MGVVRVRVPVALLHPESGSHVVPRPDDEYDENDPLVVAYRWAFVADTEIESATRAPGERRATRRTK